MVDLAIVNHLGKIVRVIGLYELVGVVMLRILYSEYLLLAPFIVLFLNTTLVPSLLVSWLFQPFFNGVCKRFAESTLLTPV